jgi:hypothetical protein
MISMEMRDKYMIDPGVLYSESSQLMLRRFSTINQKTFTSPGNELRCLVTAMGWSSRI